MAYNGSGTFNITTAGEPVVTGTVISSTAFNALTADLATGLSTAITKDGQTTTTVRVPFAQGISSTLTTDATSATTGSIITAGGISTQKALWVGTTANIAGAVTLTTPLATSSGGTGTSVATPYFNARNSVSQTVTSGVFTKATFGTVVTDTNSNFSSSRFTATLAGTYHFDHTVRVGTDTTLIAVEVFFYKNGAGFQKIISQLNTANGAVFSGSANITLAATDYVEVYIAVSGTGTVSINYGDTTNCTWFSGYWVRG